MPTLYLAKWLLLPPPPPPARKLTTATTGYDMAPMAQLDRARKHRVIEGKSKQRIYLGTGTQLEVLRVTSGHTEKTSGRQANERRVYLLLSLLFPFTFALR